MENAATAFTADFLYEQMTSSLNVISTGCSILDDMLGGGLYSGELTELYGSPAAGKTQSCLSIACYVAGSWKKNVVYFDTGGAFTAERVKEILMMKCDPTNYERPMARIQCIKVFDIFTALSSLNELRNSLSLEEDAFYQDVVLIIFDSVASLISPILGGTQNHGHALMVSLSRALKSLACDYNMAVLLTNNVVSDFNSLEFNTKPALGKTWALVPNNRIHLHQSTHESAQRFMKMTKSCRMPLNKSAPVVSITEAGLTN